MVSWPDSSSIVKGASGLDTWGRQVNDRMKRSVYLTDKSTPQAAIDAASGGVVIVPPAGIEIDEPLLLPRDESVWIVGEGRQPSIRGSANFPEGRALIEWESVAERAYKQRISNVRFNLPDVPGVMAIHYGVTAKSTLAEVWAEWMQIDLTDCWFYGDNAYHEKFVFIEGGARTSRFERLFGEPKLAADGYNTLLLEFETEPAEDFGQGADAHGLFSSVISQCHSMFSRGGKSAAIRGRFLNCEIDTMFCDGGSGTPCFDFYDSSQLNLRNLATEGRNDQPMYRFTRCDFVDGRNIGIGTPDDYYETGLGDGMELIDCNDCTFEGRWCAAGKPAFSGKGCKVVTVDADSARNTFTRWGIKSGGTPADEFSLAGTDNRVEYIDFGQSPVASGVLTSD